MIADNYTIHLKKKNNRYLCLSMKFILRLLSYYYQILSFLII